MSVEVNVADMRCGAQEGGLSCVYCYQAPVRRAAGNAAPARIDHERIQLQVARAAGPGGFSVFGGEALLAPLEDLERLWSWGLEKYGTNAVQTSGRPITEAHLDLFRRYRVAVGFSIDGPGPLNDARRAGTLADTRAATAHSETMLRRCLAEGIRASLIVTVHGLNARGVRLQVLLGWLRDLDRAGLRDARLHLLEQDGPGRLLALTAEENTEALFACHDLERELAGLRFDVFADLRKKLVDPDADATCVWNACDPWTTPAVHGIEADGSRGLCQRVHKDGVRWLPAEVPDRQVRQAILWATPQEAGGCAGCRFFLQCGGQCPGTGIGGDWRRRTIDCPTWFAVLERLEGEMVARGGAPASLASDLEARITRRLAAVATGEHGDIAHGDEHGDQTIHGDHGDLGPEAMATVPGGEVVP